jgi:hypothetical protein
MLLAGHDLVMQSDTLQLLHLISSHTVDGRNPAPPWMVETLVIMG